MFTLQQMSASWGCNQLWALGAEDSTGPMPDEHPPSAFTALRLHTMSTR